MARQNSEYTGSRCDYEGIRPQPKEPKQWGLMIKRKDRDFLTKSICVAQNTTTFCSLSWTSQTSSYVPVPGSIIQSQSLTEKHGQSGEYLQNLTSRCASICSNMEKVLSLKTVSRPFCPFANYHPRKAFEIVWWVFAKKKNWYTIHAECLRCIGILVTVTSMHQYHKISAALCIPLKPTQSACRAHSQRSLCAYLIKSNIFTSFSLTLVTVVGKLYMFMLTLCYVRLAFFRYIAWSMTALIFWCWCMLNTFSEIRCIENIRPTIYDILATRYGLDICNAEVCLLRVNKCVRVCFRIGALIKRAIVK